VGLAGTNEELAKLQKIYEEITLAVLPEHERALERIKRQYWELRDALPELVEAGLISMAQAMELDEQLAQRMESEIAALLELDTAALEERKSEHETVAGEITQIWQHTYERLTDIVADWIYELDINLKSVVDLFRRAAAQVAATWVMTGFQGIFSPTLAGAPGVMGTAQAAGGSTFLPTAPGLSSFFAGRDAGPL